MCDTVIETAILTALPSTKILFNTPFSEKNGLAAGQAGKVRGTVSDGDN